jgi:hypothetical protein
MFLTSEKSVSSVSECPLTPWEADEVEAAAREAAAIGRRAGDEDLRVSQRPLVQAGEGVEEGFELAGEELIEAAEYGNGAFDPLAGRFPPESDRAPAPGSYGDADHEESSEVLESDR